MWPTIVFDHPLSAQQVVLALSWLRDPVLQKKVELVSCYIHRGSYCKIWTCTYPINRQDQGSDHGSVFDF
jgi:hypothetical protein